MAYTKRILYSCYPYRHELHKGCVQAGRAYGWSVEFIDEPLEHLMQYLQKQEFDGAIVRWPNRWGELPRLKTLIPCIEVDGPIKNEADTNNQAIGHLIADYLIERKYRHVAYYARSKGRFVSGRFQAFQDRMKSASIDLHQIVAPQTKHGKINHLQPKASDVQHLKRVLETLPKPIGICAENDNQALDVVLACLQSGFKIPEEIGVIGVDNSSRVNGISPISLTTVDQHLCLQGEMAIHALARQLRGLNEHAAALPSPEIIQRDSTPSKVYEDPIIKIADTMMNKRCSDPQFGIAQLIQESKIPRRTLFERFKSAGLASPHHHLLQYRIKHVQSLLSMSRLSINEVLHHSGFGTRRNLDKVFMKHCGLTASQWRNLHAPPTD